LFKKKGREKKKKHGKRNDKGVQRTSPLTEKKEKRGTREKVRWTEKSLKRSGNNFGKRQNNWITDLEP